MHDTPTERMTCMEVWGGNQPVDSGVVMAGLDAWVYSRPYGQAAGGGDVHYVSSCATGRITRLLVADVSGHGQAVAQTAGALRTLMRRYVNYLDQTQFVREMNHQFKALSRDGGIFATAVVTTFFAPMNFLSLCNAGHPVPLWRQARSGRWNMLESARDAAAAQPSDTMTNIPLGVMDLMDYEQFDVKLKVGDLVLCYTDSLIESRRADGRLLGQAGLLEMVRTLDASEPARLIPALLARIAALAPGNLAEDDVTILLFRPNGLAPRTPVRDKLLAPLRVAGGLVRSWRSGEPLPWPQCNLANIGGAMIDPLNRWWRGSTRLLDDESIAPKDHV